MEGGSRAAPAAPVEATVRASAASPEERDAWGLLAAVEGVGPATFVRLLTACGSAGAVLEAALAGTLGGMLVERQASRRDGPPGTGLPVGVVAAIARAARERAGWSERLGRFGIVTVTWLDAAYPARLHGVEAEPPVLFVRGLVGALSRPRAVAVVGTRRPTPAGRALASALGSALARCGATVVSGLAFGIDAAAHHGALEAGGVTVAVVGGGLGELTPRAHAGLAERIAASAGAVLSEMAPEARPTHGTYPRRNRLISGLAEAVVVVEAPRRSGALNTAHWAAEQGHDVYAVPGRPGDAAVAGCLRLLHDVPGCRPVVDLPTLLEDLGLVPGVVRGSGGGSGGERTLPRLEALLAPLAATERALAARLHAGPSTPDRLARATGLPIEQVVGGLTLLELRGLARSSGGLYLPAGELAVAA